MRLAWRIRLRRLAACGMRLRVGLRGPAAARSSASSRPSSLSAWQPAARHWRGSLLVLGRDVAGVGVGEGDSCHPVEESSLHRVRTRDRRTPVDEPMQLRASEPGVVRAPGSRRLSKDLGKCLSVCGSIRGGPKDVCGARSGPSGRGCKVVRWPLQGDVGCGESPSSIFGPKAPFHLSIATPVKTHKRDWPMGEPALPLPLEL